MPTRTLRPNATITTNWQTTFGTGSSRHERLAVESDSAGITHNTPGGYILDIYGFDDLPGGVESVTGNPTGAYRVFKGVGNNGQLRLDTYDGATWINGTLRDPGQGVWATYIETPASSGGWTVAEINALQGRVYSWLHTDLKDAYCAWIKYDVTYVAEISGFALFVSQWLPPLMAVASHGLLKREVAKILSHLTVRPSSDAEFRLLLEAFIKRPSYCG